MKSTAEAQIVTQECGLILSNSGNLHYQVDVADVGFFL